MRLLGWIASISLLLSFGMLPARADAQRSMTTAQMEALSPSAANRKIQGDLLSILKPVGKIDPGMFRWFHGVGLTTRPVRTEYKGVCRRDSITLWYSPRTHTDEPDRESSLQAYAIEASPLFHVIDLPLKEPEERAGELRWGPDCDALDTEEVGWFAAKDAYHAVQGALVFQRAIEAEVRPAEINALPQYLRAQQDDLRAGHNSGR